MQVKIIVCLGLLAFFSSANADIGQKLQSVNSTVKNAGIVQQPCPNCTVVSAGADSDKIQLMKACVETICTDKEFSASKALDNAYERAARPDPLYDQEIQPLIVSIAQEGAREDLRQDQILLDWLKNPPELKDRGAIRLFNLFVAERSLSKFKIKSDGGKYIVDALASRKEFSNLTDPEYTKLCAIAQKIVDIKVTSLISETDPARVQMVYGNRFSKAVADSIDTIAARLRQISADPDLKVFTSLPSFNEATFTKDLQKLFSDSNQINPESIRALNQGGAFLNLILATSKDDSLRELLESPSVDIAKAAKEFDVLNILQERARLKAAALKGVGQLLSKDCRTAFELAQEVLPSEKELRAYTAKVENTKSDFIAQTKDLVCSSAADNFKAKFSGFEAHLPLSKEKFMMNMKASLAQELEQAKDQKKANDALNSSSAKTLSYSLRISRIRASYNSPTAYVDDVCGGLMTQLTPDATNYFSNGFVIGPLAFKSKGPNGISFHELGHKLEFFMGYESTCSDKSRFNSTKLCLRSLHAENTPGQYFSEDWADLVSVKVNPDANNIACVFARKTKDQDYAELSLQNANGGDPHSSDLFRLLHLEYIKTGKVSVLCEKALAARGESANFKNCFR